MKLRSATSSTSHYMHLCKISLTCFLVSECVTHFLIISVAPVAPPQQASASSPTSTSINIVWQPPPAVDINGMIVFYVVEVTENRTGRSWTHHSSNSPTPFQQFTLLSLHPYYVYTCRVAAFTIGSGPFTPDFEVVTMEDRK